MAASSKGPVFFLRLPIERRRLGILFSLLFFLSQGFCTDCATNELGPSEAMLVVYNGYSENLTIGLTVSICYKCLVTPLCGIHDSGCNSIITGRGNNSFKVGTSYYSTVYINHTSVNPKSECLCNKSVTFIEHAHYMLVINDSEHCHLSVLDSGDGEYLPILYAAIAMTGLSVLWVCLVYGYKLIRDKGLLKYCHVRAVDRAAARDLGAPTQSIPSSNYGSVDSEQRPLVKNDGSLNNSQRTNVGKTAKEPAVSSKKKTRLLSLDAFRGFSLVIMIFVNYGGGGYWFFNHSKWNGLTIADLVFPWFVWIMGVSLVFSFSGRKKDPVWQRLYQIFRRTVILFALGLFLNSDVNNFQLETWRIPGVLQRFAISYFVAAMAELVSLEVYALIKRKSRFSCWEPLLDLTNNWIQWLLIFVLELISLLLTFLLTNGKCPKGYLGPGGISEMGAYENCTGGAAGVIDVWLFGEKHLYQHPTAKDLYHLSHPYDPEGFLGSLNSVVICLLGVQAGRIFVFFKGHHIGVIIRLLLWGALLGVLSALLCEGQLNEGVIPINKNLWSLSYTLAMAGSGFVLLALFYFLIDVVKVWNGAPFKYPGMNSIFVYMGHEILGNYFPFHWPNQEDTHLLFLSANLVGAGLWMLIAYYCFCIEFFVKI